MTYQNEIQETKNLLNGNLDHDLKIISTKLDYYQQKHNKQMIEALETIAIDIIPPEYLSYADKMLGTDLSSSSIHNLSIVKMKNLIFSLSNKYVVGKDYDFPTVFDYIYFVKTEKPKTIQKTEDPIADYYLIYATLLLKNKDYSLALEALNNGLEFSPYYSLLNLTKAEVYLSINELELFKKETMNALKHAYHEKDVAKCFSNLGFYYSQKEEYDTAICCYVVSNTYEKLDELDGELNYIENATGKPIEFPDNKTILKIMKSHDLPCGPNDEVLEMLYQTAMAFKEQNENEMAKKMLQIVYNLTKNSYILEEIKELSLN